MRNQMHYSARASRCRTLMISIGLTLLSTVAAFGTQTPALEPGVDDWLTRLENRYQSGFSANFYQKSTLQAMGIDDEAGGKALFSPPGRMRWIYEQPEPYSIITDGNTVWIYRPAERQVMMGQADSYFGGGGGTSFLSDIKRLRSQFDATIDETSTEETVVLRLVPVDGSLGFSSVYLKINRRSETVKEVVTYNAYQDRTLIRFSQVKMAPEVKRQDFQFTVPAGTETLMLSP